MQIILPRRRLPVLLLPALPIATSAEAASPAPVASAELARAVAEELYVWAYPLVLMDATRKVTTNFEAPTDKMGESPVNVFSHARAFPPASFRAVVRPNFDTLYSVAWLDLGAGPLVLTLPRTDRYHVFQMMDGWSEVFAAPGTRMTDGRGGMSLVAGPGWRGEVPSGMELIRSPTDTVWIIGRIQTNGASDYGFVHGLQEQVALVPLGQQGRPFSPPRGTVDPAVDMHTPPMVAVDRMGGEAFFTAMMAALKKSPPHIHDQAMVARMRRIGLEPGRDLGFASLPATVRQALDEAPAAGLAAIRRRSEHMAAEVHGWTMMTGAVGYFGADYVFRAAVALGGLGANRPEDAIYPIATKDGDGQPLNGANRYTLRFERGQTPPVEAFWSVTMYDQQGFPVENPINRQAIGDRDGMAPDADGGVTIRIQRASPGAGQETNWLPAPEGAFSLAMRCYSPREALPSGAWAPPPVRRLP